MNRFIKETFDAKINMTSGVIFFIKEMDFDDMANHYWMTQILSTVFNIYMYIHLSLIGHPLTKQRTPFYN